MSSCRLKRDSVAITSQLKLACLIQQVNFQLTKENAFLNYFYLTKQYTLYAMSTGYQIKDQEGLYYLTFQVVDWIDIFSRQAYRDIVIDSFQYATMNKDFQLFAYVIMSNHIHLIANSSVGKLSDTIRDIKKYTCKKIIETIQTIHESRREWLLNRFEFRAKQHQRNRSYQVWTHENHAIYLYSPEFIAEKLEYLHQNPVRVGIVVNPEDYLYSSARNYAGLESIIEVEILSLPVITVR
jgi:REP element-mobilizing transposase RayT